MLTQLSFADRAAYVPAFTEPAQFVPYIRAVCERHGLPARTIDANPLPGTHPVFLVGAYAVKFFADLFDGERAFAVEGACYELLRAAPLIPVPQLVASGQLFPHAGSWRWPYIVSTRLPGASLSQVYDHVSAANREKLAQDCNGILRTLHGLPLAAAGPLVAGWDAWAAWLERQRAVCVSNHWAWGTLPPQLLAQIDQYLPAAEQLVDRTRQPVLLHSDLNADHLLVEQREGHWAVSGVIDFGDARVGDALYDLVALHLGLFRGERRLLRAFLHHSGTAALPTDVVRQVMCLTLLHEFNVLDDVAARIADLAQLTTLDELAQRIWDVSALNAASVEA
jgi:hygromycin-B 7''-O-kinase